MKLSKYLILVIPAFLILTGCKGVMRSITSEQEEVLASVFADISSGNVDLLEDTTLKGKLRNASNSRLSYKITSTPQYGKIDSFNSNTGEITYTPNSDFSGVSELIIFTAQVDGGLSSSEQSLTINIVPVNDRPEASALNVIGNEDEILDITPNVADVDSSGLAIAVMAPPQNATVKYNSATNRFVLTPAANYFGNINFTYIAYDGESESAPAMVNVTVKPVNDAPVAMGASNLQVDEDTKLTMDAQAVDLDNDNLIYSVVSGPSNGTVVFQNNSKTFTYTPKANYSGADNFTFKVNDSKVDSAASQIALTVKPISDAPIIAGGAFTVNSGTAYNAGVNFQDVDTPISSLRLSVSTQPSFGSVQIVNGNSFTYLANANVTGTQNDKFTLSVNDGSLSASADFVVKIIEPLPELSVNVEGETSPPYIYGPNDLRVSINEGALKKLVFKLSKAYSADVSFRFATNENVSVLFGYQFRADAGVDFTAFDKVVTIPAGVTTAIIDVGILDDLIAENEEGFFTEVTAPVNVSLPGGKSNMIVGISVIDDDTLPKISFTYVGLTGPGIGYPTFDMYIDRSPSRDVEYTWSANYYGGCRAGNDYSPLSGTGIITKGTPSGPAIRRLMFAIYGNSATPCNIDWPSSTIKFK